MARVELSSDRLRVRLLALGAAIRDVTAPDSKGAMGPVHLGLAHLAEYADRSRNPHLGGSIGRYANRIAGAHFDIEGVGHDLSANDGPNTLHGGADGWDRRLWQLSDVCGSADGGAVVFSLVSPDGDQGFPGRVEATATYELDGPRLRITYQAATESPTVVCMTNHGYWNLDGRPTVADHHLAVAADEVLPVDDAGIPEGGLSPVEGTPFDLRSRTALGPVIEAVPGGLDHCFAVRGRPGSVRPAAVLDAPRSGRWMRVATDQRGVQVYTGNHLGLPFAAHGSVSLETQAFPDSPNRPGLGSVRLDPGERYLNVTELLFGVGDPPAV